MRLGALLVAEDYEVDYVSDVDDPVAVEITTRCRADRCGPISVQVVH